MDTLSYQLPKVHFIGGIHGVGKTTFASALAAELRYLSVSAGQLIRDHDRVTSDPDKRVFNISENQNKVLMGLIKLRPLSPIILDGHFCLIEGDESITSIPLETYAQLCVSSIAVLIAAPDQIGANLRARDGKQYARQFLEQFQESEVARAKEVAETLKIPFGTFLSHEVGKAFRFVSECKPNQSS
jgi:adenylate kinase